MDDSVVDAVQGVNEEMNKLNKLVNDPDTEIGPLNKKGKFPVWRQK